MENTSTDKESSISSRDDATSYHRKSQDSERDSYRPKRSDRYDRRNLSPSFPENTEYQAPRFTDAKLSSLVRKIVRDDDLDRRFLATSELLEYLLDINNFKTIFKSGENMLPALTDIFFERTSRDLKYEVCKCLGQLGIIITHESKSQRFFDWLLPKLQSSYNDDAKIYLSKSLHFILKQEVYKPILSLFISNIMTKCQNILENVNSTDMLANITSCIVLIAKHYPPSFKRHFRDTVDILVGWHIDSTQKSHIIELTADALISFNIFWSADLSFTFNLLGQFLEDMDAYIDDLIFITSESIGSDVEAVSPNECTNKIIALLRVFTTVVKCLGVSSPVESDYLFQKFDKILITLTKILLLKYESKMLIYANRCMQSIIWKLGSLCPHDDQKLFSFVQVQTASQLIPTESKYNVSLLGLLATLIEILNVRLPVEFLTSVLGPQSIVPKFASTTSSQTMKALLSMYSFVMALKNVPLLQTGYRLVLSSLEIGYNILLKEAGSEVQCLLVETPNEFAECEIQTKDAETVVNCYINVLLDVGNAKNNLIAMWALSPNIFSLYSSCLKPLEEPMLISYPNIHYAVIHALYSHCSKHGNFLTSSHYISATTADAQQASTCRHLSKIFLLLASLLANPNMALDARCLCLNWCLELIQQIIVFPDIYSLKDFLTLLNNIVHNGFSPQKEVSIYAGKCLITYLQLNNNADHQILENCRELCAVKWCYRDKSIQECYLQLQRYLPLHITLNNAIHSAGFVEFGSMNATCQGYMLALRNSFHAYVMRTPTCDFQANNFAIIMTYVLDEFPKDQIWSVDWLEDQFFSCHRTDLENVVDSFHDHLPIIIEGNNNLLWMWGTWEAARFCVSTRLKTPLGKPLDTFVTFEECIKKYSAHIEYDENDKLYSKDDQVYKHLKKPKLLLLFIEQLEKQLYNAYEGCSSAITVPSKVCKTFFRTNKTTCIDWLSRVRLPTVHLARRCCDQTSTLRHSLQLLSDLVDAKAPNYEIEQVLIHTVEGLCGLRAVEALQGLHVWAREATGRSYVWIKIFVELAQGRLESGLNILRSNLLNAESVGDAVSFNSPLRSVSKEILKPGNKNTNDSIMATELYLNQFLYCQAVDCCMKLGSWDDAVDFSARFPTNEQLPVLLKPSYKPINVDYIKASQHFSEHNFHLVKTSLKNSYSNLLESDQVLINGDDWLEDVAIKANVYFMYAIALLQVHNQDNFMLAKKYLAYTEMLLENILTITTSSSPIKFHQEYLQQYIQTKLFLENLSKDANTEQATLPLIENIDLFDANSYNLEDMICSHRFYKLQQNLKLCTNQKTQAEIQSKDSILRLSTIRLARKQKNYILCKQLLKEANRASVGKYIDDESIIVQEFESLGLNSKLNLIHQTEMDRQSSKLLHGLNQQQDAIEAMLKAYISSKNALKLSTNVSAKDKHFIEKLNAKSLLTLVKWLPLVSGNKKTTEDAPFITQLKVILDPINDPNMYQFEHTETDLLMEKLLTLSTKESPTLAKTWFTFANWCYRWGHKSVDYSINGSMELSASEVEQVRQLLPDEMGEEDCKQVISILTRVYVPSTDAEEDIGEHEQECSDEGLNNVRRQLVASCASLQYSPNLEKLLLIWKNVVQRVYHYYKMAATAYFNYLRLNDEQGQLNLNEDGNITATLRLLRLLVKHAWELRHVLEDGLAKCPAQPWIGIVPQLFSRLNHPEMYVRQSVSDLLCRVGAESPHLIVYTAVVGCIPGGRHMLKEETSKSMLLNECFKSEELPTPDAIDGYNVIESEDADAGSQEDDATIGDEKNIDLLQNRFSIILNSLQALNPRLVNEVQLLVNELRRITLLWDELWFGTVNQMYADVNRRIKQLDSEVKKALDNKDLTVEENQALVLKKHLTVLRPTLFTLEKLRDLTNGVAETPHEKSFQLTFMKQIEELIDAIANPTNPKNPSIIWNLFKQLHHDLQQKSQKKSDQFLNMEEVSTKLSQLKSTVITMPGLVNNPEIVTIESIHNIVQILPTKTRPKKMIFIGSDGMRYPYLFKGLEDLHLDERIMQFLSIVNNMLAKSKKKKVPTATLR